MSNKIMWCPGASLHQWRMWSLAGILSVLSFGAPASVVIDFTYKVVDGGTPLRLVYSDGSRTYLVLAGEADAKSLAGASVMAIRDNKRYFTTLSLSSPNPYIVGVYDKIELTIGGRKATVTRIESPPLPAEKVWSAEENEQPIKAGKRASRHEIPLQKSGMDGVTKNTPPDSDETVDSVVGQPTVPPTAAPPTAAPPAAVPRTAVPRTAVPRTAVPRTAVPRTAIPRTAIPPTAIPPTAIPPTAIPPTAVPSAAVPRAATPLAAIPPLETREELPNRQVARVIAGAKKPPSPASAANTTSEHGAAGRAADDEVAEYKVMIPFARGKTALGKEGEKAMVEVAQIGPIAKEIRIRAPGDPGGKLYRAHQRAAEIHKLLVKAGLVRQRITIEAINAVSDSDVVRAEVALIVDLESKGDK